MAVQDRESAGFAQRHELDLLRCYDWIDARPATWAELPAMVAMAHQAISAIAISPAAVERVYRHHPECIFPFRQNGRIDGGIAYLFLNEQGHEALLLDEIDFSAPDVALLAGRNETPSAIYVWAMAARGRAAAGLGNVASRLRASPYTFADYYAQPATPDGARFLAQLGFERTPSFQPDLWTYRRICNRAFSGSVAAHRYAA